MDAFLPSLGDLVFYGSFGATLAILTKSLSLKVNKLGVTAYHVADDNVLLTWGGGDGGIVLVHWDGERFMVYDRSGAGDSVCLDFSNRLVYSATTPCFPDVEILKMRVVCSKELYWEISWKTENKITTYDVLRLLLKHKFLRYKS